MAKAEDCKCCVCGAQAAAFWPMADIDIPAQPYCRACLDKAKRDLWQRLMVKDIERKQANDN